MISISLAKSNGKSKMYVCMHVRLHAHMHACMHTYIHICIQTYMHTHIHLLFFHYTLQQILTSLGSRRPSHLGTCLGARKFRLSNLLFEEFSESLGDISWRTTFYDFSVGQASEYMNRIELICTIIYVYMYRIESIGSKTVLASHGSACWKDFVAEIRQRSKLTR